MKYELYIKNHKLIKGIEDYIQTLKEILKLNKINLSIVSKISEDVDVLFLIENFVDPCKELFRELKNHKSNGVKICVIHTEFLDNNYYFNIFSKRDLIFRNILYGELLLWLYRKRNNGFYYLSIYFCILFIYLILGFFMGFNFYDIKKRIFFAIRDCAFSKLILFFDIHIFLSYDLYKFIKDNHRLKHIYYLQYYVDPNIYKKFKERTLNTQLFYMTGYKTRYRVNSLKREKKSYFNNFFVDKNLALNNYNFLSPKQKDYNLLFTDENKLKSIFNNYTLKHNIDISRFEIYLSQRKKWPYKSTMRTIRSFRNLSIPLNIRIYRKSVDDLISINVRSLDYFIINQDSILNQYISNLPNNIKIFNQLSDIRFNQFVQRLMND